MMTKLEFSDFLLQFMSESDWRRSKVFFNNLIGRRTVSNLFWGAQYGLLPFFNLFKHLSATDFQKSLHALSQQGLILYQDNKVRLTKQGVKQKQIFTPIIVLFKFKGIGLYTNIETVQSCIQLAVQITSEFAFQNNRYYPIQASGQIMNFCKKWFSQNKSRTLPQQLEKELSIFLAKLSDDDANAFANRFIGHENYGLTDQQIANALEISNFDWKLKKLDLMTRFISWTQSDSDQAPLCAQLVAPWLKQTPVSMSSDLSYQLFLKYTNLDRVAQLRQVKLNTIKEHLLEAAILLPDFPFTQLLPASFPDKVLSYLNATPPQQWQFTTVVQLDSKISFFEFRLLQIQRGPISYVD